MKTFLSFLLMPIFAISCSANTSFPTQTSTEVNHSSPGGQRRVGGSLNESPDAYLGADSLNWKHLTISDFETQQVFRIPVQYAYQFAKAWPEIDSPSEVDVLPDWIKNNYPVLSFRQGHRLGLDFRQDENWDLSLYNDGRYIPLRLVKSISILPGEAEGKCLSDEEAKFYVNFVDPSTAPVKLKTFCSKWVPTSGVSTGNF